MRWPSQPEICCSVVCRTSHCSCVNAELLVSSNSPLLKNMQPGTINMFYKKQKHLSTPRSLNYLWWMCGIPTKEEKEKKKPSSHLLFTFILLLVSSTNTRSDLLAPVIHMAIFFSPSINTDCYFENACSKQTILQAYCPWTRYVYYCVELGNTKWNELVRNLNSF